MKLSDYVWDRIADEGVEDVFMLPGGGCMHLVDSLGSHPRLRYICNLHEQGTAVAVDAYAQVRGFGAGLVTTGPGGTNAITGVAAAFQDSTPCIFISGQVKRADLKKNTGLRQMGFQEIDIVSIVSSITKYAVTVENPEDIRYHLDQAIHRARNGRPGPVWIDIPLDVQAAEVDPDTLRPWEPEAVPDTDPAEAAHQTLNLLSRAERPAILVGNGVRLSGAVEDFLTFAGEARIPILTTWKAADFMPEEHPLFAGRPGGSGQRAANFTQQNSDVLLVLGARLDLGQTAYMHELFARGAKKIVVDIDEAELRKLKMPLEMALCMDAGPFIRSLRKLLPDHPMPPRTQWLQQVRTWKERYPVLKPEYWAPTDHVDAYVLIEVLSECLHEGDLLVPGSSGQASELTCQALRVPNGLRMLNSQGLGPMGFGIPAALGACVASGGKRTVCIDGDGGFQMNIQELEVIHRLGLPITFFVLDNQGYGSIRSSQRAHFNGRLVASDAGSGLTLPNTLEVAKAYGMRTARLETHKGIRERVQAILAESGPCVCEVRLDPDQPTLPRVTSYQKADGSMGSRPMEDMFPLLDREELRANLFNPEVKA
ncbi:thiamine pyrophosphate-binding protein [Holophaga foetida]|uniref:thiamine pyrophosphate-binding protein n=1 Tax=Holophaga foetida TaxID=35839 RepID=UPI00024749FA|nr:thiamine pyrophosphate-binding protein [Holophaga foetida]